MRLFDIDINIHFSWWLVAGFIILPSAFALDLSGVLFGCWVTLVLMSIIVGHELAHALTARYFGLGTRSITLFLFGGVAMIEHFTRLKPREEFYVSAAGPAFNIVLAALSMPIAYTIYPDPSGSGFWLHYFWFINLVIGLFNLVPAYPMDGGRIFRSFLAALGTTNESYQRATNVAHWTSFAVAAVFLTSGLYHGQFFLAIIGAFIIYVVYKERQGVIF